MKPVDRIRSEETHVAQEQESLPKESSSTKGVARSSFSIIDYFYGMNSVLGRREFGYLPTWVEKAMGSAMYPKMMFTQGGTIPNHFELPHVQQIMRGCP